MFLLKVRIISERGRETPSTGQRHLLHMELPSLAILSYDPIPPSLPQPSEVCVCARYRRMLWGGGLKTLLCKGTCKIWTQPIVFSILNSDILKIELLQRPCSMYMLGVGVVGECGICVHLNSQLLRLTSTASIKLIMPQIIFPPGRDMTQTLHRNRAKLQSQ